MTRYGRSFRLEKELCLARKKIAKFETVERSSYKRKVDLQQEFVVVSRKVGRLKTSCCSSLEKENRIEQEILLCHDKTCHLESHLSVCHCKVKDLETTNESLENKKEALHRELLKTHEKNADFEIALESIQRERGDVKNGEAQLCAESYEYASKIRKLESEKEFLQAERMKLQEIITTLENQIDTLIDGKSELSTELKKGKKSVKEDNADRASVFDKRFKDGGNHEKSTLNHHFILDTHREMSTDEIRKLHEVATDLETKYATCKTELEKQQTLITTIITREKAASRAVRETARDLQLRLDKSRREIEKRDVMIKTLAEDKRGLEHNIQEFKRNYQQKCDFGDAELDEKRTLSARQRIGAHAVNTELQDYVGKYQQGVEIVSQEPNRQKTVSSGYHSHEQKAVTSLHKGNKSAHDDYAKLNLGTIESVSASESLRQDHGERKKDIFRGRLSNKRQEKLIEARSRRQFHASVKSANESEDLEWNEPHADYESKYRECCHEQNVLKTLLMAAEDRRAPTAEMEDDLDESLTGYNGKCEEYQGGVDGVRSENGAAEIENCSLTLQAQELKQPLDVSNGDEMASSTVESEFVNGHASPVPDEEKNDFVANVDQATTDFDSLKTRKEELEQLCEVLMDERDKATRSLRERDEEVLRLRMRSVETEHEKADLKIQLAKALSRSDLLENELASVKEENEKLRAEVERLRKRIEELEAENRDLKCKLQARADQDHADGKKTAADLESAELTRASAEEPVSALDEGGDESNRQEQEPPHVADKTATVEVAANENAPAADEVVVKRRENRRTAPNYYRHSFAGSLPRPFHSFELHSQHSFDHGSKHERSESIHSDTSEDSESGSHAAANVPSFMRRKVNNPYLKSGFSPVQFNYQPLPESISSRRDSWLEGVRARGGSLNRAHDSSSDSESSGIGSSVSASVEKNQEWVERDEIANALSSAPDELVKHAENAENSTKDLPSASAQSTHEDRENVSSEKTQVIQSNGQSQVDGVDQQRTEHVSDLVNMWQSKRTEALDV
ncbi:uncharacterized protein LOC144666936 [Oculina patagonica]